MIVLDCETRSRADLNRVGARRYAEDPTTELLCVCWLDDDMHVHVPEQWRDLLMYDHLQTTAPRIAVADDLSLLAGQTIVGNNVIGFDRLVLGITAEWIDLMDLARSVGLPGALQAQGELLFGIGKDPLGERLIRMLSKEYTPPNASTLTAMVQYCIRDVELSARVWDLLRPAHERSATERVVRDVDMEINDRGFLIDVELCTRLLAAEQRMRAAEREAFGKDAAILSSWQKFVRHMREAHGIIMPNARAETCRALLSHPDVPREAKIALWSRIGETRAAAPKLEKALASVEADGRLRGTLRYHVAIPTGRWGGRGFQPQNLPRPVSLPDIAAAIDDPLAAARDAGVSPDDVLSTLVRSCITAPEGRQLVIADYASIEARGLCWIVGDERRLDDYRAGSDPYVTMAQRIYGCVDIDGAQRAVGKIAVLGCGYQLGAKKFESYAAGYGIDLAAAGIDATTVVEAFRDQHPLVAGVRRDEEFEGIQLRRGGLWRELGAGVMDVVQRGEVLLAGRCEWRMEGDHLECVLPSGRVMTYRNAKVELVRPAWAPEDSDERRPTICYDHVIGKTTYRKSTYGGRLTENVVQAICRDLLAEALIRLRGHDVVFHVHDEIVAEVSDDGAEVAAIMAEVPAWAEGFPIEVEWKTARRYGK